MALRDCKLWGCAGGRMNNIILCVYFVFIFFPFGANAVPGPNVVYRVDTRSPVQSEAIFNNGFTSRGENEDLLAHVIGDSLRNGSSGLIATTESYDIAQRIAEDFLMVGDDHRFFRTWIYTITPDNSFYDINSSLLHHMISGGNAEIRGQALHLYRRFSEQREFAAARRIAPERIINAIEVRRLENAEGIPFIEYAPPIRNDRHAESTPEVNPGHLRARERLGDFEVFYTGDLRANPIPAELHPLLCDWHPASNRHSICESVSFSKIKKINDELKLSTVLFKQMCKKNCSKFGERNRYDL